jgi:hypothetical protein
MRPVMIGESTVKFFEDRDCSSLMRACAKLRSEFVLRPACLTWMAYKRWT